MNNSTSQVKAQSIDNNTSKNKILYAGAALLVGLLVAAAFSNIAKAETMAVPEQETKEKNWTPNFQIHDEVVMPFQLKSQKLSH